MKKAHFEALLEVNNLPTKLITKMIGKNIFFPIFKTSQKTIINPNGKREKQTQCICSNCSHRFSISGEVSTLICPECGSNDTYYSPRAISDLTDDFAFSKDVDIYVCTEEDSKTFFHADFQYGNSDSRYRSSHATFVLDKATIEDEIYYILHEYKGFFNFDETTGQRNLMFLDEGNMIIFNKSEIANVRSYRRSTASFYNSYTTTYDRRKIILAEDTLFNEFFAMTSNYNANNIKELLTKTKTNGFYSIDLTKLDNVRYMIKENRPVSKSANKREMLVKSIYETLPKPTPFTIKNDHIYYTITEIDEIANSQTIKYICPDCGGMNSVVIGRYQSAAERETMEFSCEHCGTITPFNRMRDLTTVNNIKHSVNVVCDYNNGIVIFDALYRCLAENGRKLFVPITENHYPKTIIVIDKEFDKDNIMANTTILRGNGYGLSYSIAKTFKVNYSSSIPYIHNMATNFNMQWSAVDKINEQSRYRDSASTDTVAAFALLYRKYPVLEKFVKEGQSSILSYILERFDWTTFSPEVRFDLEKNDVASALRISKSCLKILNSLSPDRRVDAHNSLQLLYNLDNNITAENYQYITDNYISVYKVADICRKFGLSIHQICEYIERVRLTQCVSPQTATSEWADYLDACDVIGSDLNDRRVKYPAALRTEHDKVVYKKKIIEDEQSEEKFQKTTEEYGKKYSHKGQKYMITYPKTLKDLFEEGRLLNHCVGTYGDAIKRGDSVILFVRKVDEPDVPYFTLEVKPTYNAITQFYGHSDHPPHRVRDKELIEYISKWAKSNDIRYSK